MACLRGRCPLPIFWILPCAARLTPEALAETYLLEQRGAVAVKGSATQRQRPNGLCA